MAKAKFDPAKRDPNFKVGELPEVKEATTIAKAMIIDVAANQKNIIKSETADPTCGTAEEME